MTPIKNQIESYCSKIGSDPLLVQGAGGNVSWKDGNILWVKASGAWLAHAELRPIFIPIDLLCLLESIKKQDFEVAPKRLDFFSLKPSIETILHAVMPQKVVVHLHAVQVLSVLVRVNAKEILRDLILPGVSGVFVPYFKPGAALGSAISRALVKTPDANVIYLQNHGIVIGGSSVSEVDEILQLILKKFDSYNINNVPLPISSLPDLRSKDWRPIQDLRLHALALDPLFYKRLNEDWAIYPDHIVFLGPKAITVDDEADMLKLAASRNKTKPEIVFLKNKGVFSHEDISIGRLAQLGCYLDVMQRQADNTKLSTLTDIQIAELLNWDAEQYRISIEG